MVTCVSCGRRSAAERPSKLSSTALKRRNGSATRWNTALRRGDAGNWRAEYVIAFSSYYSGILRSEPRRSICLFLKKCCIHQYVPVLIRERKSYPLHASSSLLRGRTPAKTSGIEFRRQHGEGLSLRHVESQSALRSLKSDLKPPISGTINEQRMLFLQNSEDSRSNGNLWRASQRKYKAC